MQVRPGTETAALMAMANVIARDQLFATDFIAARTEGLAAWDDSVREMTPERAAEICGVRARDIESAARIYAKGGFVRNKAPGADGLYPPSVCILRHGDHGRDRTVRRPQLRLSTSR